MIYWTLFWTFVKVGLFTFGGGYAMIPLIQQEVIERYHWMTIEQFTEFVGIAESTPGPFAINISTFAGLHAAGVAGGNGLLGSLCATSGVVLPSIVVILVIAALAKRALKHWAARSALDGAQPVVVGLIGAATVTLMGHAFFQGGSVHWASLALTGALLVGALLTRLSAMWIILIGAVAGVLLFGVCGLPC